MTTPTVAHTAGRVILSYRPTTWDAALTRLARNLHDDGDGGTAARALARLGEADLILSMEPGCRAEWGIHDPHDQAASAAEACDELRDITSEPAEALTVAECWELIVALMSHVAALEAETGRAAA